MKDFCFVACIITLGILKFFWLTSPLWIPCFFFYSWGNTGLAFAIGNTFLALLSLIALTLFNKLLLGVLMAGR